MPIMKVCGRRSVSGDVDTRGARFDWITKWNLFEEIISESREDSIKEDISKKHHVLGAHKLFALAI